MRPLRLPLLLVLLVLGATGPATAADAPAAPPSGPTVDVPVGVPVALDGRADAGEWQDAATPDLGASAPTLLVKHARGTWTLALRLGRRWEAPWTFRLLASPDVADGKADLPGSVVVDVDPLDHDRPHALVQVRASADGGGRWSRADGRVVARFADLLQRGTMELAIPLALLGLDGDAVRSVRWVASWSRPGTAPSLLTFPAGLDLSPVALGAVPADVATTARWARTTFAQPKGPGIVAAAEWDALVAADRELAERGERAHRAVKEVLGTFDEAPAEHGKVDAPLERALADLRWIAQREAWSRADGRAYATALWRLNRATEAFGVMRGLSATSTWNEQAEDVRFAALVGQDAERFEEAAALWETLASLVPAERGDAYRDFAAQVRAVQASHDAERAARRADDERDDLPLVRLRTTRGDVTIRLLEDDCPESAKQFVHLAQDTRSADGRPFYDGTRFHRVVAAGLAQGGDPSSRGDGCATAGTGGSPWYVDAEKNPRHRFFRGAVGWTMGLDRRVRSQFFVMTAPKLELDGNGFCCFATVVAGMDVVDRLEQCDELLEVRVLRKRPHPYVPTKKT